MNEKAMNAKAPSKLIEGMSTHLLVNPEKLKETILKFLIISVTRYNTTAEDTQRKRPKVIRFIGKSNRFITGLAKKNTPVKAIPDTNSVCNPFSKTIPAATLLTTHKEKVSRA
jgi:hypothetical protein